MTYIWFEFGLKIMACHLQKICGEIFFYLQYGGLGNRAKFALHTFCNSSWQVSVTSFKPLILFRRPPPPVASSYAPSCPKFLEDTLAPKRNSSPFHLQILKWPDGAQEWLMSHFNYLMIKVSYNDQKKLLLGFLKFKLNKWGVSFLGECMVVDSELILWPYAHAPIFWLYTFWDIKGCENPPKMLFWLAFS